ncbi:hypothetical protein [Salinibacter ruber]|uniref:Uncharacterized protein n=1 Tax=Salinibacter ruber TaxID=146919 RepID=A0AAW5P897_9BACT|nr:hypothetical protein [Salinibacter ruber]MCS4157674.1 hypothetical protein [Salinibacter ruber]
MPDKNVRVESHAEVEVVMPEDKPGGKPEKEEGSKGESSEGGSSEEGASEEVPEEEAPEEPGSEEKKGSSNQ